MSSETNDGPSPTAAPEPSVSGNETDAVAGGDTEELLKELERTRKERDDALGRLRSRNWLRQLSRRFRSLVLAIFVILFAIMVPLSTTLGWVRSTIVSTDGWVRTVRAIPSEPAVAAALGTELTNQIFSSLDVQQRVSSALPPRASFVAGPVTNAVEGYVEQGMTKVVASPQFNELWVQANRFAHAQLVAVLEGKSRAISTTNGQVVLNLVPLLNAALGQLQGVVSGIVGKPVTLPAITPGEVPARSCQRISAALGVSLPSDCAQIPLFPADKLTQAQQLVRRLHRYVTLLFVLTPLVAVAALALSRRRRRTALQLACAALFGLVVFRRVVIWLRDALVSSGRPENKAARQAILAHVMHGFFLLSAWVLAGLVVAAVIVAVTGPYAWARTTRRAVAANATKSWTFLRAVAEGGGTSKAPEWIGSHAELLQVFVAALAVLLLALLPISFAWLIVLVGVAALVEFGLQRTKHLRPPPPGTDSAQPASQAASGP